MTQRTAWALKEPIWSSYPPAHLWDHKAFRTRSEVIDMAVGATKGRSKRWAKLYRKGYRVVPVKVVEVRN